MAREWHSDMSGMEAARIKKAYLKLLLAFEQHISHDSTVEVRKVLPSSHSACLCKPYSFRCLWREQSTVALRCCHVLIMPSPQKIWTQGGMVCLQHQVHASFLSMQGIALQAVHHDLSLSDDL